MEARPDNQTTSTIDLHAGQRSMLFSTSRTTVVTAGQGGGKTTGWYWWQLANMRASPGESHLLGFPNYGLLQRVVVNDPDPDRMPYPEFLAAQGENPRLHATEKRIECKSGQIFFTSDEALEGWEGAHVKTAVIDEFDLCSLEAYHLGMERTRMRHGYVLLAGTPRKVRWVKEELQPTWLQGTHSSLSTSRGDIHVWDHPDVRRIQFPSTLNPLYDFSAMEEARRLLPTWEYQRLYLGELSEMQGGGVWRSEWWQRYTELPEVLEVIQVWDTAFKDKTQNDYSVCATWARCSKGFYLIDIWRRRAIYPVLLQAVKDNYNQYRPSRILMEDAASGQSVVQDIRYSTSLPIIPVKVDRDKYSRATAVSGQAESGRCFLPESAPWAREFIDEHTSFPGGEYDDQVDTTSMALGYLALASRTRRVGLYV